MWHRFHEHGKKQHEKCDKWCRACYQRQSEKKGCKTRFYKCHVARAVDCEPRKQCGVRRSANPFGLVTRETLLRSQGNWLWAESLRMHFRLRKRNRVFMLLLAQRFLKAETPPGFYNAVGCNARAKPRSTRLVIMHWLLNGCNAGEPSRSADAQAFHNGKLWRLASYMFVWTDGNVCNRENIRKCCKNFNSYKRSFLKSSRSCKTEFFNCLYLCK